MIAGFSYTELKELRPGFVLDEYVLRREYDDEQHGIKRGDDDDHDISDEDEAEFEEETADAGTGD